MLRKNSRKFPEIPGNSRKFRVEQEQEQEQEQEYYDDNDYDVCPHQKIIDVYHQIKTLPKIFKWTEKRRKLLMARWREATLVEFEDGPYRTNDIEFWRRFFSQHVMRSQFLQGTGRPDPRTGRTFKPTFVWMINPENFAKIIERKYEDQPEPEDDLARACREFEERKKRENQT